MSIIEGFAFYDRDLTNRWWHASW